MANPRRAATVVASIALLESDAGQPLERYAVPLDRAVLFRWVPGDTTTVDHVTVLGHTGGTTGRWLQVRCPDMGEFLTDADATIYVSGNTWRIVPDTIFTANRTITLSTDGAVEGDRIEITKFDESAYTLTIVNGGEGGGNMFVLPAGEVWGCIAYFDGTNFIARSACRMP